MLKQKTTQDKMTRCLNSEGTILIFLAHQTDFSKYPLCLTFTLGCAFVLAAVLLFL